MPLSELELHSQQNLSRFFFFWGCNIIYDFIFVFVVVVVSLLLLYYFLQVTRTDRVDSWRTLEQRKKKKNKTLLKTGVK